MRDLKKQRSRIGIGLIVFVSLVGFASGVFAQEMAFEKLWPKVQKEGVLRVGVAACDPHCIKDPKTGEWSGVAINVLKNLAAALEVKLEPIDTTWDYIIAGVLAKKWDIAVALNERATRALVVNFSIPFYFYEISFVYKKTNPKLRDATKFEDFDKAGAKCAVMSGTAQDKALTKIAKNMEIVRLPALDESRMAVVSGRADFVADDSATNYLFYLANREWATTYTPEPPISREGVCFGFRKSVSLEEIQVLDIVIRDAINTGKMAEWEEEFGTLIVKRLQ
jgi:polar amino acid transport system substrate-binding protein